MNNKVDYRQITDHDRFLDARDLIKEILQKLWIVIIVAVIFAGAFGGYKYMQDTKNAQVVSGETMTVTDLENSMSPEDLATVEYVYELQKNIQSQREYVGKSVYLSTDGMNQDRFTVQYCFSDPVAADMLIAYVENTGLTQDVLATGKVDMEARFLNELLFIDYTNQQTAYNGAILDSASQVVSVGVIERDEEKCQELGQLVMSCIANYQQTIQQVLPESTVTVLGSSSCKVIDETVFTKTNNYSTNITNSQTRLDALKDTLSDKQKNLLSMYVNGEKDAEEVAEGTEAVSAAEEQAAEAVAPQVSISKKYVGIGAIGGFVLAIVVLILIYVFRGTVNTVPELQELYNVRILGQLKKRRDTSASDPTSNAALAMLKANLKSLQVSGESVLLAGVGQKDAWTACMDDEMKAIQVADIQTPEAITALADVKKVIMVDTLRHTKHSKLAEDIKICLEQGAEILGVVVIK